MRLEDLSVRTKLHMLTGLSLLGAVVVGACELLTMARVQVTGPVYREIVEKKDLVADILPPPMFLVEPYLVVMQMRANPGEKDQWVLRHRMDELEALYRSRREFWTGRLSGKELRRELLERAVVTADEFFMIYHRDVLPVINDPVRSESIIQGPMRAAYERHREAVYHVVLLANANADANEVNAAYSVAQGMLVVGVAAGALALGGGIFSSRLSRGMNARIASILSVLEHARTGDQHARARIGGRDELGRLAERCNELLEAVSTREHELREALGDARVAAGQLAAGPVRAGPVRGRVLLAEDYPINQLLIAELVRRAGFECQTVEDGHAAIAHAMRGGYDLVLLDYQMPGVDGPEAARSIRRAEAARGTPRVPIVALTASESPEDRARCLEAGMDGFLTKPIDPCRLADALAAHSRVQNSQAA